MNGIATSPSRLGFRIRLTNARRNARHWATSTQDHNGNKNVGVATRTANMAVEPDVNVKLTISAFSTNVYIIWVNHHQVIIGHHQESRPWHRHHAV